jgi:hypothetical protein
MWKRRDLRFQWASGLNVTSTGRHAIHRQRQDRTVVPSSGLRRPLGIQPAPPLQHSRVPVETARSPSGRQRASRCWSGLIADRVGGLATDHLFRLETGKLIDRYGAMGVVHAGRGLKSSAGSVELKRAGMVAKRPSSDQAEFPRDDVKLHTVVGRTACVGDSSASSPASVWTTSSCLCCQNIAPLEAAGQRSRGGRWHQQVAHVRPSAPRAEASIISAAGSARHPIALDGAYTTMDYGHGQER